MLKRCFGVVVLLCVTLASCFENQEPEASKQPVLPVPEALVVDTFPRTSITFILGEDESVRNPYYSLANQYYRLSDSEKTEIVIDTIFSLLGVRNYLDQHCPVNGRPWGLINLVSHGNEFIDLSVRVTPHGDRASAESLLEAVSDTVFRPLDSTVADKRTLIDLHGCAVGNNAALLKALGVAFGGSRAPIRVKASKLFEYYSYLTPNRNPQTIRHYYAKVWYGFFKPDSFPAADVLAAQFKTRYPRDSVDWQKAVRRQYQSNPSEAYHMTLRIPIIWEDFYDSKEQLPDLRTRKKQQKWLEEKTELQALMLKTQIPREYFDSRFYMLIYETDSGIVYSNKVKARAGVICVIKPVLDKKEAKKANYLPFIPHPEDSVFSVTTLLTDEGILQNQK